MKKTNYKYLNIKGAVLDNYQLEQYMEKEAMTASVGVQFDFNPMSGF